MANLDNLTEISKLDEGKILASIEHLPEQIKQVWQQINYLAFPSDYKDVQNIVVCGMGGSALSGRIVHSLMFNNLSVSIEVVTGYKLPNYVNEKSLVILSSYSGNTEETVEAAHDAIK